MTEILWEQERLPPSGYYRTTEEWFRAGQPEQNFMEFYNDHPSNFTMPKGLDTSAMPRQFHQRVHLNAFVAVIPGGRLWGRKGAVITDDNKLLWDVSMEYWETSPEEHSVFRQLILPRIKNCGGTLGVLTHTASDSYFHWMMDVLPRIDLIRKTGIAVDKYVLNTYYKPLLSFQDETLNMLGIPPDARITIDGNVQLNAEKLLVPSLIGSRSHYPAWTVRFLRKEFAKYIAYGHSNVYRRIYISREDSDCRNVVNEKQVMGLLEKYGFKKMTLSGMPVTEQIRIFASADIVVAPHGANLTNIIFCRPGTKVVEIFSPYYVNTIYWVMSNYAGLDYYYLLGKRGFSSKSLFEFIRVAGIPHYNQHIEVDIDQLAGIMKLTGIEA
ncbi:glycosyltransferase family 61 protein [Paenibacillus alkalitolerans]|uniref:glycosyltransferase family 61 protein n=1 Tax=Paenibacillus alkalitolerans TaxID=2799335 RepID=UPI0018F5428C|nr:glycosyltransferase family 61 protein [Paenibacillus alkalitolerans]